MAIRAPAWLRVWLPLVAGFLALTLAGLAVQQERPTVAFIVAGSSALLFWNGRVPMLSADATGVRLGHRRSVPWSDVAELGQHPADGSNHPVELIMRDGTRRPLLRHLAPDDLRRGSNSALLRVNWRYWLG